MQHYTCLNCQQSWSREDVRGRVPKLCPTCRDEYQRRSHQARPCASCGQIGVRAGGRYCSHACAGKARRVPKPARQPRPVRVKATRPVKSPRIVECTRCGSAFSTRQPTTLTCSARCARKAAKLRRRTREAGTYGDWRWSDFMRIARKFNYCCAYCRTKPDRLDPDHVVPLSRGGPNTTTNLLPACPACNCDKRALSLSAWADSRHERGLPPVRTSWSASDPLFAHLTALIQFTTAA
jgi:hypothetical protein